MGWRTDRYFVTLTQQLNVERRCMARGGAAVAMPLDWWSDMFARNKKRPSSNRRQIDAEMFMMTYVYVSSRYRRENFPPCIMWLLPWNVVNHHHRHRHHHHHHHRRRRKICNMPLTEKRKNNSDAQQSKGLTQDNFKSLEKAAAVQAK